MEPFHKIKDDPSRQQFLKDFQDELDRQEEKEEADRIAKADKALKKKQREIFEDV